MMPTRQVSISETEYGAPIKESYLSGMNKMSGTDSILEAFDSVSKEKWLSKIREDLRGKNIEETDWEFDDELTISPFVHADDIENSSTDIGYDPHWEIAEEFNVQDDADANHEVLEALAGGCEVIMLKVHALPDWSILLAGVNLGMIKTYVIPGTDEMTQALISSLDDFLQNLPDSVQQSDNSEVPVVHIRNDKSVIGGPAHLQLDKTVVEGLAKTIHEGIELITQPYDHDPVECVVEIGDAYFVEIARLRALRILWANSLVALGLNKPSLFVEGRFSNRDMTDDVHRNMIAAGSKALSAISGGVDRLIIAHSDANPTSFHRRISRNIHQILRYESKLDAIEDPVKGAYYIENMTRQLVEKAWLKLIELNT
ncbi:MAG: hypothetical protein DRI69_05635 [Bacteroidetes bacterium]|nr:MAG: hypothetical protein DRI69_05635 [Bacteroidota bacterium]